MCKFCDLNLNRQYESLRESDFRTWPEEIKDYAEWMFEVWDEGWEWRIENNGNVRLIMYNEGGYNSTTLDCKFCPKCGCDMSKAALEYLNSQTEREIDNALSFEDRLLKAADEHKAVLEYLKDK